MFNDEKKQVEQHKFKENLRFKTYLWKIRKKWSFSKWKQGVYHVVPKMRSLSSFKWMTWKTNQFDHPDYQFPNEVQGSFTIGLHHIYPTTKTYEKIATP